MAWVQQFGGGGAPAHRAPTAPPAPPRCRPPAPRARRGRWQAHCRRHPPHLAVAAFADGKLDPVGGNVLALADRRLARWQLRRRIEPARPRRQRGPIVEHDTVAQLRQRLVGAQALHLHPVGLLHFVSRVGDAGLQRAVAGQQQQALAVGIEPARRMHAGQVDELLEPAPAPLGRELAEHAIGFMEADEAGGRRSHGRRRA